MDIVILYLLVTVERRCARCEEKNGYAVLCCPPAGKSKSNVCGQVWFSILVYIGTHTASNFGAERDKDANCHFLRGVYFH